MLEQDKEWSQQFSFGTSGTNFNSGTGLLLQHRISHVSQHQPHRLEEEDHRAKVWELIDRVRRFFGSSVAFHVTFSFQPKRVASPWMHAAPL